MNAVFRRYLSFDTNRQDGATIAFHAAYNRAGRWQRLGPWITEVDQGSIMIRAERGAANFSGLEFRRKTGDSE